jgi:glycosyltransferase involved in cell wall biosynthesis
MSEALPGVAYIVTIYNKARYLEDVVRALERQEGAFERQHILVDDGSTDGSADVAARLASALPNARLIRQSVNRGPSLAVNRGLAEARMPFTQIIDGDDILAPYATRLLLTAALKSGCGAVYGRNAYYASPAELRFPAEPETVAVTVVPDALYHVIEIGHAGGSTYILDAEIFRRAGGCDERVFVQDQSIPQRMALAAPMGFIDCLICMGPRDDPARLMKTPLQQQHDQSLTALLTLRDHPELPPRFRRLVQKQVTGRAWKHVARLDAASWFSRYFMLFLAARLPGVRLSERTLEGALDAFRRDNAIRLMAPASAGTAADASADPARARQSAARTGR